MYNNESVKELSNWIRLVSGRILLFENEWIKLNTICNDRSRVVRLVNAQEIIDIDSTDVLDIMRDDILKAYS
jgi:hypothetical protein